jgi:tetratricopeptide (TPR) repeat protein
MAKVPLPSREIIAGLMRSGRQAMSQGRVDRAIVLFRQVRDTYPDAPERPEANLLLAQALEARGDNAAALLEYRRLTSDFPDSPQAVLARNKIPELQRPAPPGSISAAAYLSAEQLDALTDGELQRLQRADVTLLIVEATQPDTMLGAGAKSDAGVLFKTDWAPVIRDQLAEVVSSGHQKQMQVWASLPIRLMEWTDPRLGWADWRYNPKTGELVPLKSLDLMHPAVSEYLLGFLMDLAGSGVDGVLLMAEPASGAADGFSPFALRAYERDMGQKIDPARLRLGQADLTFAPEFWRWVGWKQREQLKIVDRIIAAVRKSYPRLKVAFELHLEAVTNPRAALARYGEDLLDLRRSRVDYIVLPYSSASSASLKSVADAMNGKRFLLSLEAGLNSRPLGPALPNGTGLIFKEKVAADRLTKPGR